MSSAGRRGAPALGPAGRKDLVQCAWSIYVAMEPWDFRRSERHSEEMATKYGQQDSRLTQIND